MFFLLLLFIFVVTHLQPLSDILLLTVELPFSTSYVMVFHTSTMPLCAKVWDDTLAKTAEDWAHACMWEHGPPHLLRFLGQNLSVRTGR